MPFLENLVHLYPGKNRFPPITKTVKKQKQTKPKEPSSVEIQKTSPKITRKSVPARLYNLLRFFFKVMMISKIRIYFYSVCHEQNPPSFAHGTPLLFASNKSGNQTH